jgi:alkaline phosphatase
MNMKAIKVLMAALLLTGLFACQGQKETEPTDQKAKYIFLFIGDGMGHAQMALAESYLSYKAGKLGGEQVSFTQFPYLGTCSTYSMDWSVTCSAASGTAIATGTKTNNNYLGVDVDGKPLESIAYVLKRDGYKIGIMTSVQVNHATPGAFYAHNIDRGNYYEISKEIAESGFDFFGGSGFYRPRGKEGNDQPANEYLEERGYKVCYGTEEFNSNASSTDKIVFIQENGREDTDFYVSKGREAEEIGTDQMLSLALDYLGDEQPFFIMCEGGEIDWASHGNKTMSAVHEILDLDAAVKVALEFYNKHPEETLIIVTADHATGGAVLGQGKDWIPENFRWDMLEEEWITSGGNSKLTYEQNKALNDRAQIGWTTGNHTGEPVPIYAIGKGAEKFCGRMENTDIKGKILGE